MTDKQVFNPEDAEVRILPPDFSLKQKIGAHVKMSEIFTPERIAGAQKAIDDTQAEFLKWAEKDLIDLEEAEGRFAAAPDDAAELDRIRKISFSLKCQAGTFGFSLGSEVAKSLYDYAVKHESYSQDQLFVIHKHVEALRAVLSKNIQGNGGQIGVELKDSLQKIVQKFK